MGSGASSAAAQASPVRVGSLCTGYGGLDLAVMAVLHAELAWCAESDPDASAVLVARFPHAFNLGDITRVDWAGVPSVDLVTAGFPCQDISYAGRGAGIQEGTRSGLWHHIAGAVRDLRPSCVLAANVAALRTRGLGRVLADLAALGYDTQWACLRASAAGAPHRRDRMFILACQPGSTGGLAAADCTARLRHRHCRQAGLTRPRTAAVAGSAAGPHGDGDAAGPAIPPSAAARAWQDQAVRLAGRGVPAAHPESNGRAQGLTEAA